MTRVQALTWWSMRRALAVGGVALCLPACTADPGYGGRLSREWVAQLADSSGAARADAAEALGHILAINPADRRATEALIRALADTVDGVRLAAGDALAKPGVLAVGAIPGLVRAASDSAHPQVRASAVRLLGTMATTLPRREALDAAPQIAAALGTALGDANAEVRARAIGSVTQLGPAGGRSRTVVRGLVQRADDADPSVRVHVLEALRAAAPPPDTTLGIARRLLRDSVATVRLMAAYAIARVGEAGATRAATSDALVAALNDESVDVRTAAAVALGAIGPSGPRADSALRAAREDPDSLVRREAAHALERFHVRGGQDPRPPEPSRIERCRTAPRGTPDC